MPEQITTSRIIFKALNAIINLLKDLKMDYALMGGMALAVWGRERASKDIDIMIGVEEDKIKNLMDLLKRPPFNIRSSLKRLGNSVLLFATYEDKETGFPIDLDLFIAQTEFQKESLKKVKEIEILGQRLRVITVEDLVLYKLLSNRPIDFIDTQVLLEENKKDIDTDYLRDWAKRLGIEDRLTVLFGKKK